MAGMRLAGIDDALELRVREDAGGEEARRQMRPVGGAGRRDRGHGGRLHELRRVRRGVGDVDRLQRVALIEAGGEASGRARRPVAGLIGELDEIRRRRRAFDEAELRQAESSAAAQSRGRETRRRRGGERRR